MSEETWSSKRGETQATERDMQEFMLRTPPQTSTPRERQVEHIAEAAKQRTRDGERKDEEGR